jgi:small subunit ribosomal protein S16
MVMVKHALDSSPSIELSRPTIYPKPAPFTTLLEIFPMLRIRLKRLGRKKQPFYRICVMNQRDRRNGRPLAEIGYYNPMSKELKMDKEAYSTYVSQGAQPSETCAYLFTKAADDGSLVQLPKKPKKEHLGEANIAKPKAAKEAEAEAVKEVEAEEAAAAVEEAPAAEEAPAEA